MIAMGHIKNHTSSMKAWQCRHPPFSSKTHLAQAPPVEGMPLVRSGEKSAAPLKHETVWWVKRNEKTLLEEMSSGYLRERIPLLELLCRPFKDRGSRL